MQFIYRQLNFDLDELWLITPIWKCVQDNKNIQVFRLYVTKISTLARETKIFFRYLGDLML